MTTTSKADASTLTPPDAAANGEAVQAEPRELSPAARRALAEAEARREAREAETLKAEREIGGRGGADPARYGDWEINGRAIDF
ncbi:DUF1674 domain-containing protein [Hoeflea ulvae]|uniref:DUF1674 domain-containing protein n=1 Tax=Hoeflea ulvae TaxID=2983764 RepID=A0ABT3YA90_9HYPH|nr:DUF1674 domain-containing protein [Hoeflea ulvae]MCY0092799.1 DUF1674 domain-containing protein [Hoeflea ulvae]